MKYYIVITIISGLLLNGCQKPVNKENYLQSYQQFIIEVKMNWRIYSVEDWEKQQKINEKYSKKYYSRFLEELTPAENMRIQRFNFAFHFYKGDITIQNLLSGQYNDLIKGYFSEFKEINLEISKILNGIRKEDFITIVDRITQ